MTVNLTDSSQNAGVARGDTYINIEAIFGSAHNDTLIGDGGMSWLFGGNGDDVLRGMGGDNYLYGEQGNDTFIFAADFGWDTIDDFEAGAGAGDVIRFEGIFTSFAEVQAAASQSGSHTVIDIGANMRLTLNNVAVTGLHQDDFQFA
ncbi:hypothetical protein [Roseibium sp.]|uniref:hypothetical protein n=1 Tax=Roseibium sp. TaxID=1936156 RepID=UPI003D145561